jgi:hypothetical protein
MLQITRTKLATIRNFMVVFDKFNVSGIYNCINYTLRSQWPRGLRNELSSPAQTLGSWDRFPLEAWRPVCIYSVFVLSCVQVAALRRADIPSEESY